MHKILRVLLIAVFLLAPVRVYAAESEYWADENVTDKTWLAGQLLTEIMDLILEEYVGEAHSAEELYEAALYGIMDTLDVYSEYLNEDEFARFSGSLSGRLTGIGVMLRTNEDGKPEIIRVLPDTPAMEAGLRKGDCITRVNGTQVADWPVDDIVALITDPAIERVAIQVKRAKSNRNFTITKREIPSLTVFTDRIADVLGDQAGESGQAYRVITITSISETTADDLRTALSACKKDGVKGIVLDMRGNTGGYLDVAVDICTQLLPKGPIYHTVNSRGEQQTIYSSLLKAPFAKMAVLVDADTASAAELITAALQDAKAAVVIGETTFGKGVIQSLYPLPTGGAVKLTTEEYLRRSGKPINKLGVTPDITVDMRRADYETENDTALIKALEWMLQ